MADHKEIWLDCVHNETPDQGRMWAEDNPFDPCEVPGCPGPTRYVRADLSDDIEHNARAATYAHMELDARNVPSHDLVGITPEGKNITAKLTLLGRIKLLLKMKGIE